MKKLEKKLNLKRRSFLASTASISGLAATASVAFDVALQHAESVAAIVDITT